MNTTFIPSLNPNSEDAAEVLVVGGGAAGMMAAGIAAQRGRRVALLEPGKLGAKLAITGKGRCNLTNNSSRQNHMDHLPTNGKFLYSAFAAFDAARTMEFFTGLGVKLKTERGDRVFPVSDSAKEVVAALRGFLRQNQVVLLPERAVSLLMQEDTLCGLKTASGRRIAAQPVVLATGGKSYPLTGSTGDGYRMAAAVGHTIIPPVGSLVPVEVAGEDCQQMQGLSLRNVRLTVRLRGEKKPVFSQMGELLFTHFGVSGPLVLSASAHMHANPATDYTFCIDLKPALSEQQLDVRLVRDLAQGTHKQLRTILAGLVPAKMVPVLAARCGFSLEARGYEVTRPMRETLLHMLKSFVLTVRSMRPIEEAVVTSGGVRVSEVNPKTMESKLVKGLFFAGELLDVDGYTGGYNLQIAWSTGYVAGSHA